MPWPRSNSNIHSAALSKKYLSCVTATTVPGKRTKNCSSHSTDSASKWLVGSSNNNISGLDSSNLHKATRRFSPPDKGPIFASQGGKRSASAAISSCVLKSLPLAAMMFSHLACSSASLSKSASGSAYAAYTASNLACASITSPMPDSTSSRTVLSASNCGSCGK